jgi:hypothetical protein
VFLKDMLKIALAAALLACGCKERPPARPGGAAGDAAAATSIGVPACDEYLDKVARCISTLSEESANAMRETAAESRRAWQELAATEDGRAVLADACKAALETTEASARAAGCSW